MSDASRSGNLYELREDILAYIQSLTDPVLVEHGCTTFFSLVRAVDAQEQESSQSAWRLEVEFGKLLLEFWDAGRSCVRRIERVERDGRRLRLWAHKPGGWQQPLALDIREAGDVSKLHESEPVAGDTSDDAGGGFNPALRRAEGRQSFEAELVAMLTREFPHVRIESVTHRSDREHCFSGCYTRGWARQGREAWAFLGLSEDESPSAIENALAYGLIWLDWLRGRAITRQRPFVGGLKLILPPVAVAVAAHRAAYLDQRVAAIEILEWARGQEHPVPVDLRDYGNVETRLTPRLRGARLAEELRPFLRELLGENLARLTVVPDPAGETLSLRVFGLEVARVEGRSVPRVFFGLEGEYVLLEAENRPDFEAFLAKVVQLRHRRSADRSHPFYRLQPERWLESLLVEDIGRVDPAFVPDYVYPQVPAFSGPALPDLSRGVIDILGVVRDRESGAHRLAVVELKLDEDPHLPLQGLDYWLRVKWLEDRAQFREYGYFPGLVPSPEPPLLYLVCPAFRFHSTTESVLRYFHPSIRVVKVGVNQRWREGVKVLFRKTLVQGQDSVACAT